jgi:branched-chain amino acid transport system permease protein
MLNRLLSGDYPRSKVLAVILLAVLLGLAFAPFLFPGVKPLSVAAKVLVFVVLVASFDLLLGYTGIVSFAHTMFFGIGAYGIAIATTRLGPPGAHWPWALAGAAAVAAAVAGGGPVLAARAGHLLCHDHAGRGGGVPDAGLAAFGLHRRRGRPDFQGARAAVAQLRTLRGTLSWACHRWRLICYYLLFVTAVALVLALLRIVNSPFGRVLQAIRENEFRAEAIGYRVVVYRTTSSVLSALFATLAGCMLALWLRYNGPDTSLSFEIMMDCLLIVVIGGMGTIYGSAIGAVLFLVAQSYLQDLLRLGHEAARACPGWRHCSRPTAGCCGWACCSFFSVYYFPTGVVGRLRAAAAH